MEQNSITAETAEVKDTNAFELNDTLERAAKAPFQGKKVSVTHELNRPSLQDLQKRDSKQPYRSQQVEENVDQVLANLSGKADVELYDKLVVRTTGYKYNVVAEQTKEERQTALESIPANHKISIIQSVTKVSSEVVYDESDDDEIVEFVWSEDQTYRVRTEIGANAEFVVYSEIKEPSYRQFETYTGATKFYIERLKGSTKNPITKITVELEPANKLFDELVKSVEGMTFNGATVDVKDAKQLAAIDPYFKRSVVDAVMGETRLDMGE
jgi:hypothetical protein